MMKMKQRIKKIVPLAGALALILALFPLGAFAVDEEYQPRSGTWGTCPWELTADGTLTIHPGVGKDTGGKSPWGVDFPNGNFGRYKKVVFAQEDGKKVIAPADCSQLFVHSYYGSLVQPNRVESIDISGLDISRVANMSYMFAGCSSLTSIDVSGWDTSNVTDMNMMFNQCSSLTSINVSGWDTSKVTDMSFMFAGCSSLTSIDVSGWDTSKVTDMNYMFSGCNSLPSLDTRFFDTSKVTRMGGMFRGCSSLSDLDVSGFNTSKVKTMGDMFSDCRLLKALDVSHFDTSNVEYMDTMFAGCESLEALDISGFNTSRVYNMQEMFCDCSSLEYLDLSGFDSSSVNIYNPKTSYSLDAHGNMVYGCNKLNTVKIGPRFSFLSKDNIVLFTLPDKVWRSAGTGATYTAAQIADNRNGIADTYVVLSAPQMIGSSTVTVTISVGDKKVTATFTSSADISLFIEVRIDGKVLPASNYTLSSGSTIVTLKPEYISTLAAGDHKVDIVSQTGTASGNLIIKQETTGQNEATQAQVQGQTMHRLYNPNSGEHLYTSDDVEKANLVSLGWSDEGEGWKAPASGIPVYRLYNANGGEHHYTTDADENNALVSLGWEYEGVGWYSESKDGIGLMRLYNPNAFANNHHYTTDENEKAHLLFLGWQDEGIGWYGVK